MKKTLTVIISILLSAAAEVFGQDIVFMPQWTPQSQFAGFYLAKEKGFYQEEGLNVKIVHRSVTSSRTNIELLESGDVDIMGMQLIQGMIARADGHPFVNVMQLTQVSGLWCVSRTPISSPKDLDGKKVGRWKVGFSDFCDLVEKHSNIKIDWIPFINGISLFVYGAVDAILCYSYSEYVALQLAMGRIPEANTIKFSDFGYDCPEDALFTSEEFYAKHKDEVDRFIRASKKGWEYARLHPEEALKVSWKYIESAHIQTNTAMQRRMLENYMALQVNPATGKADYAPVSEYIFNKMVDGMYSMNHIFQKIEYKDLIR